MSTYIHRSIEPVLKEMVGQFPAVAVTGPRQSGQFILTGSQQFVLMKGLGETLAGRIGLPELMPFGLEEKTRCPGKEHLAEEPR